MIPMQCTLPSFTRRVPKRYPLAMRDNSKVRITPSILNADRLNIDAEIARIARFSDLIHLDIMDGIFVPNTTWDFASAKELIENCATPVDVHLMVSDVDQVAKGYVDVGAASVTIHAEASQSPERTLLEIRNAGARAGLAIKPGSDLRSYMNLFDSIDMLLIMTVEPGFGGQKFMESMMEKVKRARELIGERDIWLQVDGGISLETISMARSAGADTFVAGSAVFNSDDPGKMIEMLRHRAMEL